MCVARYASHYFSKGAICVPLDDQEKNICTLSSHRATRELYTKVPSHRAPVGAVCEGSMRIELRSELQERPGKNICTLSSHRTTRELYANVPSHRAPVGAVCEGSVRIELRLELCAKGALCGSTLPVKVDSIN